MNTNKSIGYCRVSTNEQSAHSPAHQREQIENYCKTYNLDLIDVELDNGISGRKVENRPAFNYLMELVKTKAISHVIVYDLSRFCRNAMECLKAIKIMQDNNVVFHSVTE